MSQFTVIIIIIMFDFLRSLTGSKPAGLRLNLKLPSSKSSGLSKTEVKKRLNLLIGISEVLYQNSKSFKGLDARKFDQMHKDLVKIASNF